MSSIVSLDVHSKEIVFCVQKKGSAEVVRRGRFPTTREGMAQWILEQRFRPGTLIERRKSCLYTVWEGKRLR